MRILLADFSCKVFWFCSLDSHDFLTGAGDTYRILICHTPKESCKADSLQLAIISLTL